MNHTFSHTLLLYCPSAGTNLLFNYFVSKYIIQINTQTNKKQKLENEVSANICIEIHERILDKKSCMGKLAIFLCIFCADKIVYQGKAEREALISFFNFDCQEFLLKNL